MGAIATYNPAYLDAIDQSVQLGFSKNSTVGTNGCLSSQFTAAPLAGTAPTTAAACSSSTIGALNFDTDIETATHDVYAASANYNTSTTANIHGTILLCDRLSHQGGIGGTTTGTITTNLPTAALTRYTDGVGVMAAVEIYTAIGTTATVARISYTNQAGTAGRTSKDIVFGGVAPASSVGRLLVFPLQDGDTGVRSVESITVDATTGTAGNYGITLFKRLTFLPLSSNASQYQARFNPLIGGGGQFEKIISGACLMLAFSCTGNPLLQGHIGFMKV